MHPGERRNGPQPAGCCTRRGALAALYSLVVAPRAGAASGAQALLAASDAVRNPQVPFAMAVALTEYVRGEASDSILLTAYARADAARGEFRSLMHFRAPARDVDKLMLKSGNDLWFFDPASRASVRISPQQRLLGQAANGDVVTVNFAQGYAARLEGEEEVGDGDRVLRRTHRLRLQAAAPDATYHAVDMWVDPADARPVKARFFSESGQLMKSAFYRRFADVLGAIRPTEVVILDGLNPQLVTVMRYSGLRARDIPERWFQRDFLAQFRPE